jgi:hypothetical protein
MGELQTSGNCKGTAEGGVAGIKLERGLERYRWQDNVGNRKAGKDGGRSRKREEAAKDGGRTIKREEGRRQMAQGLFDKTSSNHAT